MKIEKTGLSHQVWSHFWKKDKKQPKFPPCRYWPIWVYNLTFYMSGCHYIFQNALIAPYGAMAMAVENPSICAAHFINPCYNFDKTIKQLWRIHVMTLTNFVQTLTRFATKNGVSEWQRSVVVLSSLTLLGLGGDGVRICVYRCKYTYRRAKKTWLFPIMNLEKGRMFFTPWNYYLVSAKKIKFVRNTEIS